MLVKLKRSGNIIEDRIEHIEVKLRLETGFPLSQETIEELKKAGRQCGVLQKQSTCAGTMGAWSGPWKGAGGVSYGDRWIWKGEIGVDKTMMLRKNEQNHSIYHCFLL